MKFNVLIVFLMCIVLFVLPILKGRQTILNPPKPAVSDVASPEPEQIPKEQTTVVQPTQTDNVWNTTDKSKVSLSFKILDETTGKVVKVDYRDFVKGAICAEMPPDFSMEAMKAQGVCALTYALYNQKMKGDALSPAQSAGADFSADPGNWKVYVTEKDAKERYGDKFEAYWSKISEAAEAVDSIVMVYESQPILAAYHSTSSGYTESSQNVWQNSLPYLVPVESEGDLLAPQYKTEASFSGADVKKTLESSLSGVVLQSNPSEWFEVLERSTGGYITSIKVGDQTIHGKALRSILDLRSSNFDIEYSGATFTFTSYGYGHGIGMSQYGAEHMALQGSTCEEILQHYFTDVEFAPLKDVLASFT